MVIRILDPVGDVAPVPRLTPRALGALDGRAVGYVFNHHPAAVRVWRRLEDEIARRFRPSEVRRVDKPNVATSVPRGELERLAAGTDYVLVGVGA